MAEQPKSRGVGFCSLNDSGIDITTASGEMIFNIFTTLAQFERRLIQERAIADLLSVKVSGCNGGRSKISADDARVLIAKKLSKKLSITSARFAAR
ncbi:MAG: recombinase family protein [Chlorobiales bacterium]|nr:recombinase family protein [Chlorobiales bacterium]